MERILPWIVASMFGVVFYAGWVSLDRLLGGKELHAAEQAACATAAVIVAGCMIWAALHPARLRRLAPQGPRAPVESNERNVKHGRR